MYEVYFVVGEERVLLKLGLFSHSRKRAQTIYTMLAVELYSSFKSVYFIFLRREADIFTRLNINVMLKGANWLYSSTLARRPFL